MSKYDGMEQRRIRKTPEEWPPVLPDGTRRCSVCTQRVPSAPPESDLPLVAHFDQGWQRWCPAGPPPTEKDKAKRKRQRTVISVIRGGVPGLKR